MHVHFIIIFIIVHVQFKFPADKEEENSRWKDILKTNLNGKCRACRRNTVVVN